MIMTCWLLVNTFSSKDQQASSVPDCLTHTLTTEHCK